MQESVEGCDVTAVVSSSATYVDSHENSIPTVVSSVDAVAVSSVTAATFSSIQPSDILMSSTTSSAEAVLEQTSPAALAVDLTTSAQLPTFEAPVPR